MDVSQRLGITIHVDGMFFSMICLGYLAKHRWNFRVVNPYICWGRCFYHW